jgi:HAD superfamily hydrolase (TIGR01509 family)
MKSGIFRCVIFDMDGTLTQTNQLIFDSFNYIAWKYLGKTFAVPEIVAMFGPPEEGALVRIVGEKSLETAMQEYLDFYRLNHRRLAKVYPGIDSILRQLRGRKCWLAIFTGKGTHTTKITLEECGIQEYFDLIVTGNDVVNHKPSAEGIRKVLAHFGIGSNQALMVGDSVSDIKAAREAGVVVAAALWDSYNKEKVLAMQADVVFYDIGEFRSWIMERVSRGCIE